jgi:hypothetical protein
LTRSVLLGNGVKNLSPVEGNIQKYHHQLSVTKGVRDI